MTLIKVKHKSVLSIHALERAVLKFIYAKDKMKVNDIDFMFDSLKNWVNHFKLVKDKRMAALPGWKKQGLVIDNVKDLELPDEQKIFLLLDYLRINEEGGFDARKKRLKQHNIDYRNFHRLPEMFVGKEAEKRRFIAQQEYDKLKKANPEENDDGTLGLKKQI